MSQISQRKVAELLYLCENGTSSHERGQALENLIRYIFGKIPGLRCNIQDQLDYSRSQEIDLAFWNDKLGFMPYVVLIECKNWSSPVSSAEVTVFKEKLYSRGLQFGIIVAVNGITGNMEQRTCAHDVIARALQDGRKIIVFTKEDILSLNSTKDLVETLKNKILDLVVLRTSFN